MPTIVLHKKLQELSKLHSYPRPIPIEKLAKETGYETIAVKEYLDVLKTLKFVKIFNDKVVLTEAGWEANI